MEERVRAVGHENVTAKHSSTFEVTTDDYLTPAGDCILAVEADRSPADFDPTFVEACRSADTVIQAELRADDRLVTVTGRGTPELTFASERSLVGRTSGYIDDRTVMVGADAAAADLSRALVNRLTAGEPLELLLRVER